VLCCAVLCCAVLCCAVVGEEKQLSDPAWALRRLQYALILHDALKAKGRTPTIAAYKGILKVE
jgi:hypothetical protein